jgi:hypothetical protein
MNPQKNNRHRLAPHGQVLSALALFFFFSVCLAGAEAGVDPAAIKALTGAPVKVVWIQDAGATACVYSERPTLRLMGLDSEDGKGERAILPAIARYAKPLITDDGTRVMFGDPDKKTVNVVNWDGSGLRTVLENATFEDVWTDPQDGTDWFYATVKEQRGEQTVPVIRRYRLDNPKVSELVWDKTPTHKFMLSGDGRAASGGVSDGGNTMQGIFTLPNGGFYGRAGGCWPSMCPDNSLRSWVFTGNHRSINFCVTTDRSTFRGGLYGVRFDDSPGLTLTGRQELYHPRWSNNARFLTATAPLSDWNYEADVKIPNEVAEKVEIYLGKFTEDFKGIERWVKVTDNQRGDYWPDAWIQPPPGPPAWLAAAPVVEEAAPAAAEPDRTAQVFTWQTGAVDNQIADPKTGAIRQCVGLFRDAARFERYHVMDLRGGAFVPEATAKPWLDAVRANAAFAIEAALTPLDMPPQGEGVVLAFADDLEGGNVVLAQRGDLLTLRLRGRAGEPLPLVRLPRGRASHLIVSYAAGKLGVFVDGQRVLLANAPTVPVAGWTEQPLVFGDAWRRGRNWPGLLEGIGLFGREIGAAEARQRFAALRERQAGRKEAASRVIVEAKLTGTCPPADPQGIAPYKRCFSIQQYEIVKTVAGAIADKVISVAQWSVLDGRVVPEYLALKAGQTYRLALEPWGEHPEQESERSISGDFEEGALFYQVREHTARSAAAAEVPADPWQPVAGQANRLRLAAPVLIQGQDKPALFAAVPGAQLDAAGQDITFENGSLTEVANPGALRLGGAGAVMVVTVENGGSGYRAAPAIALTGGGGTGAAVEAVMAVTGVELTRLGSGYTNAPAVVIDAPEVYGGRQAAAVVAVEKNSGALKELRITDAGSGYLRVPRVTFQGGGGTGAEAQATLSIAEVFVTHGGAGYTTPPAATVGGDGAGGAVQAALQRTLLRYTDGQGNAFLRNAGAIDQDGAAILFDWAAPGNGRGNRGVENTGTWVLRHGALIQWGSSTGRELLIGSFVNSGTCRLQDGARLGMQNLSNTGLLQLAGGAVIGHVALSQGDGVLQNAGQVEVLGGGREAPVAFGLAHPAGTGRRGIVNGATNGEAKARFTIGDGRDACVFRVLGGQATFQNHPGASLRIQAGAALELITNDNGSYNNSTHREARLSNGGELTLAGVLRVQGNSIGPTGIENRGTLTIRGKQVVLECMKSSNEAIRFSTPSCLLNHPGGLLQGSGKLTYINSTKSNDGRYMQITNLGTIAPGERAADQTPESFGALALQNANVYFGAFTIPPRRPGTLPNEPSPLPIAATPPQPGILRIRIGGPPTAPDQFDTLTIAGAGVDFPRQLYQGQLLLVKGNGNTLNVVPIAGFTPHGTYRIVTAVSVVGTFDTLQYNGTTQVPYIVNYLPDGIELVFPGEKS